MNIPHRKSSYRTPAGLLLIALSCLATLAPADDSAPGASAAPVPSVPQTANGAAPALRFISLGRVTFATAKWELSAADKYILDAAAAYLAVNPGAARVLLDGHADWIGGVAYNDRLSDKRAAAVQSYLTAKGLNADLIHWKGHGKRAPIDENWTRLGRDRNRQVEIYAVYLPRP